MRRVARLPPSICAVDRRRAAMARDDVHDAADRIRAVERALRSAHDLDALDIGDRHLRQVEAAAERIGANAVNEHERVSPTRRRAERATSAFPVRRSARS